jgi:hypothetical protein
MTGKRETEPHQGRPKGGLSNQDAKRVETKKEKQTRLTAICPFSSVR